MKPPKEKPLNFPDYRSFLSAKLIALKTADSKFSHRFVNQRMGARSAGWFADIIAGRQKLKSRQVSPLASLFRLDARERDFLRILVNMEAADAPGEKNTAYAKWLEFQGFAQEDVERERFKYFDKWYYPVLREMLLIQRFDGDYAALGARLDPPVTARQAKEAVQTLSRLGLFNPDSPAPSPILVKRPGKTSHWKQAMESAMDRARPALDKFGKDDRDFSSLLVSLSPDGMKTAGEEIAALRRRLLALSERDAGKNRVYQCLFQVFPVTIPMENPDA